MSRAIEEVLRTILMIGWFLCRRTCDFLEPVTQRPFDRRTRNFFLLDSVREVFQAVRIGCNMLDRRATKILYVIYTSCLPVLLDFDLQSKRLKIPEKPQFGQLDAKFPAAK
jgi:hypothetical protein